MAVVEELLKTRSHFEVEDFLAKLKQKGKRFSRATVYRTIKQLLEANLLQKITATDGRVFYERSSQNHQHDHLICNQCGRILEIKETVIDDYLQKFCMDLGFRPEYRSLHIYGVCSRCSQPAAA